MNITKNKGLLLFGLVTVIVPMFLGALLYCMFCPDVWFVKIFDNLFGVTRQENITVGISPFFRFLRNYFFDCIWAFALTNALYIIMNNNAIPLIVYAIVAILLGIILECLQLLGIAQGTSDIGDIVAEVAGSMMGAFIINKSRRLLTNEKI